MSGNRSILGKLLFIWMIALERQSSCVMLNFNHCLIFSAPRQNSRQQSLSLSLGRVRRISQIRAVQGNGKESFDKFEIIDLKRKLYYEERRERERILLGREPLPAARTNQSDESVPTFISRWGGMDLAQEGPTRKLLELMMDSEW
jgi:hypothetical protein